MTSCGLLFFRPGTDDVLRRVYHEHLDAVFAFFAYAVGRTTAEDLTAVTFERVVRHWKKYDPRQASERTWILAIARNALIDHYRRDGRHQTASIDEFPMLAESLASDDDPLASMLASSEFVAWLRDLSDREREVLALRYAGDLTGAEIASLLDLTPANVHQITSRALKKLRKASDELHPRG